VTPVHTAQHGALNSVPSDGTALCGQAASGGGDAFIVAEGGRVYISSVDNVEPRSCNSVQQHDSSQIRATSIEQKGGTGNNSAQQSTD
jgi:hypothetical protein